MSEVTENTAIIPTATQAPTNSLQTVASILPARYQEDIATLNRPTSLDLVKIIDSQPEDVKIVLKELIRKLNPKKQGAHTTSVFKPCSIRMCQGTGDDPLRPSDVPAGHFYAQDGETVFGKSFDCAVIGYYEGQTLWPMKDSGEKNPTCISLNREVGSKYGTCASCPKKGQKYSEGGCTRDIVFYVVDRKLTGIYEIRFQRTSEAPGRALTKVVMAAGNLWDKWISISGAAEKSKANSSQYYVISGTVSKKDPVSTPKDLRPLFEAFSQVISADVYYPQLAAIYTRAKGATAPIEDIVNEVDEAALGIADSGTTDYSGNL